MPYGTARPSSLIKKSCTRTASGVPFGRHSRPAFLKSPTSSFFLVSTEITGSPAASARVTCALMKANCASRSGWRPPSRVLALACRLKPRSCSSVPTRVRLTRWPWACSSSASRRRLLQVQRSGPSGSPRAVGSSGRLDQSLQIAHPVGIRLDGRLAAAACATNPTGRQGRRLGQFAQPTPNGAGRDPGGPPHGCNAAVPGRFGLGCHPPPPATLIQDRGQRGVALPDANSVDHSGRLNPLRRAPKQAPATGKLIHLLPDRPLGFLLSP